MGKENVFYICGTHFRSGYALNWDFYDSTNKTPTQITEFFRLPNTVSPDEVVELLEIYRLINVLLLTEKFKLDEPRIMVHSKPLFDKLKLAKEKNIVHRIKTKQCGTEIFQEYQSYWLIIFENIRFFGYSKKHDIESLLVISQSSVFDNLVNSSKRDIIKNINSVIKKYNEIKFENDYGGNTPIWKQYLKTKKGKK